MKQATIQDVAERAGVSRATVSRVLNDNPKVDEALRARVREAMHSLAYHPNRAARRLRGSFNNVIGLIIPDIQNPVFVAVARGVEDAAYQHQINVLLCNADDNANKQQDYLRVMQAERVSGVIVVPTHSNDGAVLKQVHDAGLPLVLLDRQVDDFETDTVKVDNVRGVALAVKHLLKLGYRRIAFIAGLQYLTPGRERSLGYREALYAAGHPIDESLIVLGDFKTESGYRLARALMALPQPPDSIFTANSLMAMGALKGLHDLGLRVPEDVALISFDDVPWAENLCPPLTAVNQPGYELGQQAVDLLLHRLTNGAGHYRTVVLQPRLVIRESCGARLRGATPNG